MMYKKTRKHKSNRKSIKTHRRVRHIKMRKMKGGIGCGCKSDIGTTLPRVMQNVRIINPNTIMKGGSCGVCGNSSINTIQKGGVSSLVAWESNNPGSGGNYFRYNKYGVSGPPNPPVSTSGNGPLPPRQQWSTELGPQDKHLWEQNGGKRRKTIKRKSSRRNRRGGSSIDDIKNVIGLGKYGVGSGINAMNGFSNESNRNPLPWEGQFPKNFAPIKNDSSSTIIPNISKLYNDGQKYVGSL